jgi:uncharacterized LabA/DUF88 family protein
LHEGDIKEVNTKNSVTNSNNILNIEQIPLRAMIFVDGTWLYYSLVMGRDNSCPMRDKLGDRWMLDYKLDWLKIPQLIAKNLMAQLNFIQNLNRNVDIVKTVVFTSTRADTALESRRARMLSDFHRANFEVHRLVTAGLQEKCVDISLAVEMLYLATVPYAYDIAIIVTGDKDFMPAMEKTRLKGKRVAVCSMRNSCNRDLARPDQMIRDFDVIWLDDYIDDIFKPKYGNNENNHDKEVIYAVTKMLEENGSMNSRVLGRMLQLTSVIDAFIALFLCKEI